MKKKNLSYMDSVHRDGAIWNFSMLAVMLLFPVVICVIYGVMPNWSAFFKGLIVKVVAK